MDLNLSDDQEELRRLARRRFESSCPPATVRALEDDELGYDPQLWAEMADLDWLGLALPEAAGGSGGALLDLAMIYLEMGRALVPSPHLASAVIGAEVLHAAGGHGTLLAEVLAGTTIVAPAIVEATGDLGPDAVDAEAVPTGDGYRLQGTKLLVPWAHVAGRLLVVARTGPGDDGLTLFLVDPTQPGVLLERLPNIAGYPLYALHLDRVEVGTDDVVGPVGSGWGLLEPVLARATVLRCAEIVGAGERVLEMTVGYANDRAQFGRPIGQYQAVQYLCTDIAIDVHLCTLFTRQAAWELDEGRDARRAVAMAKAKASEGAQHMVRQAHEVYAGAGFMLESDLQLYTRRAKHWEFDLGDGEHHRATLGALLVG